MTDIRIYQAEDGFEAWIGPADDLERDNVINAHIAGLGDTRDEAIQDVVTELEALVAKLQERPESVVVVDVRSRKEA